MLVRRRGHRPDRNWRPGRARRGRAVDDPHPVRDPTRRIQGARSLAERGRYIHAGHRAAVVHRDPARGSANAAADVQQGLACLRVQERHQCLRRCQPTSVEMIEWGQRLRRDGGITGRRRRGPPPGCGWPWHSPCRHPHNGPVRCCRTWQPSCTCHTRRRLNTLCDTSRTVVDSTHRRGDVRPTRSASCPTEVNNVVTRFGLGPRHGIAEPVRTEANCLRSR